MKDYPFWLKGTVILIGICLFFLILAYGRFILMPLSVSALLALLLEPVSDWFQKLYIGRIASIILSLLLVVVLIAGVFSLISIQFVQLVNELPQASNKLQHISSQLLSFFQNNLHISPNQQVKFVQNGLLNLINESGQYLSSVVSTTTSVFSTIAILPFFIFFMMYYKDMYRIFLERLWSNQRNQSINAIIKKIQSITRNYILGVITVIAILATLDTIGLWAIGMDHPLFFAVFASLIAVIPYIGIVLGSIPAFLYALLFTNSYWMPVGVLLVFFSVQFMEGNFITPNIVGSRVSINPFVALMALIIGGEIWGVAGMILFVPYLGILKCILDEVEGLKPYGYLLGHRIEYEEHIKQVQK